MTERQVKILSTIISEYINTGELVSSGFLAEKYDFGIKPASIRNEMLDLETEGYLLQPHTSAGRMPTDRAYRFFANTLVETNVCEIDSHSRVMIREAIYSAPRNSRSINRALAQILSDLSDNLIITNVVNSDEFCKVGLSGLFRSQEFQEFEKMVNLTSFFDEFDQAFESMMREFEADFNMYIGQENRDQKMRDETVMMARYNLPDNLIGSVTLVGPVRMNYERNIGLMKYATEELNKLSREI